MVNYLTTMADMSYVEKIVEYSTKCLESTEATNELLSYLVGAVQGVFNQLDKANPLHHWAIDDFVSNNPAVIRDSSICVDGSVYWIKGGMDLKAFKSEIQGSYGSLYFRLECLTSREPTEKEIGKRLVIVGSHGRTRITLYDYGPGIE